MSLIGKTKREEPPATVQLDAEGEIAGGQYPPEQITVLVKKIYSECSQADCPTNVLVLPAYSAPAATVVDCNIENIVTTSTSIKTNAANPSQSKVTVTLSYNVVVDYADASGNIYTISEEFSFTKTVALYAFEGMDVIVLAMGQCLNSTISPDGTQIAVEAGLFIVIKVANDIQFVITGFEAPLPPACSFVSPTTCTDFQTAAASGTFWPPWPPQP